MTALEQMRGHMRLGRGGTERGFTLLGLRVAVAVLGIICAIAAPSMSALINNNRLAASTTELTAALQLARSEAIRRNSRVEICSTANGEDCASSADWQRWIVVGSDRVTNDTEVLRDFSAPGGVQLAGPTSAIVFKSSGLIDTEVDLTICAPKASAEENKRVLTVMVSGNVAVLKESGGAECTS